MKRLRFNHIIIIVLVIASVVFFLLQQLIFHDIHESGFLFFQDIMFLPVHILLVTFILDRIIYAREKRERLEQMNIVIGAFYSEIGTDALAALNPYISNIGDIEALLDMTSAWTNKSFDTAAAAIKPYPFRICDDACPLVNLLSELPQNKKYLLDMFNNPNLLEHDTFTNMLWALYHLIDELENRDDLSQLADTDMSHIGGDIVRAYGLIVYEWIFYMKNLKTQYPYLWSLAVRKNPFAENTITVQ